MRIAIEAQRIFRQNKHGMDFVVLEVIRQLQQIDTQNQYFIFVAKGPDRVLQETSNFKIIELQSPSYPLWEQVALPLAIKKVKPDLLHCTSNTAPICCDVPTVLTLHDMIFLEPKVATPKSLYQLMGWYYRKLVVPLILPKMKQVITVSNFERNHMIQQLGLAENQIKTIYNGYAVHFKPTLGSEATRDKYIQDSDYIFFLGNTDPKKNVANTLKGYSLYRQASADPKPLLLGDMKPDQLMHVLQDNNLQGLTSNIVLTGYVPNHELPVLYSYAFAFLYTSLRESFGIPLLEAMACGTPVITSNCASMPEVAQEAALQVDPRAPQQIANALLRLERDAACCETLCQAGLARVKQFSWHNTALQTLDTYRAICSK